MAIQNPTCCGTIGSRVTILINGVEVETTGKIEWDLSAVTYEKKETNSGRSFRSVKPDGRECTFESFIKSACLPDIMNIVNACDFNMTIVAPDNRMQYLFGKCSILGKPKFDVMEGTVSGLSFLYNDYQEVSY